MVDASQAGVSWDTASELECLAATSLLYAYAVLNVEPLQGAVRVSGFPREQFTEALSGRDISPLSTSEVVRRCEEAWAAVHDSSGPVVPVRVGDYDVARAQINDVAGRKPKPGSLSWPVSANTIRQALGGESGKWSVALERLGLVAGAPGRTEGSTLWTDEQLRHAWDEYGDHVRSQAESPSIPGYEQWREQSDTSAPSVSTLINRLGGNSWRGLRDLIAAPADPPPQQDESTAVRAQRGFLGVQEDYLAGLEARNSDLNEDVKEGVAGANEALLANADLLGWARLSVETQRSALEIEKMRSSQAAQESKTRHRADVFLGLFVILGSFGATALGVLMTWKLHVY